MFFQCLLVFIVKYINMGKQKTTNEFIRDAKLVHGDKYDYSKTEYYKAQEKVTITCPMHGDFIQKANSHLNGYGCPICGLKKRGESISKSLKNRKHKKIRSKEETIDEIKKMYGDKYDFSKFEYKDLKTKVCLICPIHGEFWKTPTNLIYGNQGCPKCAALQRNKTKTKTKEDFIKRANEVHFGFYNYDKVLYEKARKCVTITCPIHGDFQQSPDNHLKGCGCPHCQSSTLERSVRHILNDENIEYIQFFSTKWLRIGKWHKQTIDFYLPQYNIGIECQGIQHIKPIGTFGSKKVSKEEFFDKVCKLDDRKKELCDKNNLPLIYYAETDEEYRFPLCRNKEELINEIKTHKKLF